MVYPTVMKDIVRRQKNSDESKRVRDNGNILLRKPNHSVRDHLNILKLYNESMALAPNGSEELATAYNNRSVLLLHIRKYPKCLVDIARALEITNSPTLKVKLLTRKAKAIGFNDLLDRDAERETIKTIFDEVQKIINDMADDQPDKKGLQRLVKKSKTEIIDYQRVNPPRFTVSMFDKKKSIRLESVGEIPIASDAVEFRSDGLFATRDVKVGEILVIEETVGHTLPSQTYLSCSHCLTQSENCVPCEGCIFAVYCTEKCRLEARSSYHDLECTDLDFRSTLSVVQRVDSVLNQSMTRSDSSSVDNVLLARRMLALGMKECKDGDDPINYILSEYKRCTSIKDKNLQARFFKEKNFSSQSLQSWFQMKNFTNTKYVVHSGEMLTPHLTAILKEDIFKNLDSVRYDQMIKIMSQLIFLLQSNVYMFSDGIQLCCCEIGPMEEHFKDCSVMRGILLSPFCGMMDYSCVPNTTKICIDKRHIAFATAPIKQNEQILTGHGYADLSCDPRMRHKLIKRRTNLKCHCLACREQWPPINLINDPLGMEVVNQDLERPEESPETIKILIDAICVAFLEKLNVMYNLNIEYSTPKPADEEEVAEVMKKFYIPPEYKSFISTLSGFLRGRPEKQKNDAYEWVGESWIRHIKSLKTLKTREEVDLLLARFTRKTGFRIVIDVNGSVGVLGMFIEKIYSENTSFIATRKTLYLKLKLGTEVSIILGGRRKGLEFSSHACLK